ncbi:MAG: sterol desaturase family protein [Oleispira sp.]|nr:sterol desaturase family protein [Oleispira sp.]
MKHLLKISYFPLFIIGFIGAGIYSTQQQMGFHYTLVLMAAALFVSFVVERVIPYNQDWNQSKGDQLRDLIHFVVNETMNYSGIFLLAFIPSLALSAELWPQQWPFFLQVLFALLIFDVSSTLFHYFSHKNTFFWRFHAIHHAPKRLYGFNGIMKHPVFQLFDSVVAVGPLLLLGMPQDVAFMLVYCIFIQLLMQHSNADMKTGWLRLIFATAEVHRFHHLKGKQGDVNFGLFLSIWDRLLGTAYYEHRTSPLADLDIGIGSEPDYPKDYLGQIQRPFKAQKLDVLQGDTGQIT